MERPKELPEQPPIDLTAIKAEEFLTYYNALEESEKLTGAIITTTHAYHDNYLETTDTVVRLKEAYNDLYEDYLHISSSQTTSAAFLQLHSELTAQKVPLPEITSFFKQWLTAYANLYPLRNSPSMMHDYLAKLQGNFTKPDWFKKGKKEWIQYLGFLFQRTLNIVGTNPILDYTDEKTYSPLIIPDEYPDWYEHIDELTEETIIPEVQKGLDEDSKTRKQYGTKIVTFDEEIEKFSKFHRTKQEKYELWLEIKGHYITRESSKDLKSWLIYLKPAIALARKNAYKPLELDDSPEFLKTHIDVFCLDNALCPELLTVWLEHTLDKLGINTPDGISAQTIAAVLTNGTSPDANEQLWQPLKELDKKQYKFLRYELSSLVSTMSQEERNILSQYLSHAPLPQAIAEMAHNIHSHEETLKNLKYIERNITRIYKRIDSFGIQWLTAHYKELYADLITKLKNGTVAPDPQPLVVPEQPQDVPKVIAPLELKEPLPNPFDGWQILYTNSVTNPGNEIVDFSSLSHDELVHALDEYLGANKISTTVKTSSIVNCLLQIINTPEEIERFTSTLEKKYTEYEFKKRKRGSMRILYQLDPENKTLVFNLYKKKRDMYNF